MPILVGSSIVKEHQTLASRAARLGPGWGLQRSKPHRKMRLRALNKPMMTLAY